MQEKGATKLQYNQFLHALMLIADKRRTGFSEVAGKIQRFGINRRDASMADFLIMRDPLAEYEDTRDLERPPGLPKLHRSHGATSAWPGTQGALTMMPCAADGISAVRAPAATAGAPVNRPVRGKWAQAAEGPSPAQVAATGNMQGGSLTQSLPEDEQQAAVQGSVQPARCVRV